jgi:hypothetical protein
MKRYSALLALALAAAGCETEGYYEGDISIASFARLESGLAVQFSEPGQEIALLEVSPTGIGVRSLFSPQAGERIVRVDVGPNPSAATALFVFTAPIDEREIDIVDSVTRVTPGAGDAATRFELGSYFGALAFHPGGRYALLYHPPSDQESAGGLFNQNEVGVLDLSRAPGADNPRLLTIAMGGRSVEGVAFPGELNVAGQARDLAVFEADGAIVLLDLADPSLAPSTVKLKDESDARTIVPEQLLARPADAAHDPMLILRSTGAQEVFAVSLVARPDGQPGFAAALNQYDSGLAPSAMCLAEDGDTPLLLVAGLGSTEISVIDIDTASSFSLALSGIAGALLPHTRSDGAAEIVMYGASQWVDFLAVDDLAEEKGSNLEELFIQDGVASAWVFGADELLAIPESGYGLTIVDLAERGVTRLTSYEGYAWGEAGAYGDMLFYAVEGDDRVISLNLGIGHPEPLVLDERVFEFDIFPASKMGLALHDTPSGRATLFPLDDPRREAAFVVDGLWLRALLDADGEEVAR